MKNKTRIHFKSKKPHTAIKHDIFQTTLETAMNIADRYAAAVGDKFTYIDLYCGQGIFDDGGKGSPIIALETACSFLGGLNRKIKSVKMLFIDKEESNRNNLQSNIYNLLEHKDIAGDINYACKAGEWALHVDDIQALLKTSNWGFIFVDPCSTELDTNDLIELLKPHILVKDVIVLINYRTLVRLQQRDHKGDRERVSSVLGSDAPRVLPHEFKKFFQETIQVQFAKLNKAFTTFAAIPVSVKGKLIKTDYFYLVLLTNSCGVADAFLGAYAHLKEKEESQFSMFAKLGLAEHVNQKVIEKGQINLHDLLSDLYSDFISWEKTTSEEIPTTDNVHKAINELSVNGNITVRAPDALLYKKEKKKILQSVFKNNNMLKNVILESKH